MVCARGVVAQLLHAALVDEVALVVGHEVGGYAGIAELYTAPFLDFVGGARRLPDAQFVDLGIPGGVRAAR